jgi:hypothetical protein
MEPQVNKQEKTDQKLALANYRKSILSVMETGNRQAVNEQLALYKQNGVIQFDKVLTIPPEERIPALIQQPEGRARVSAVLSASLKSAMDNINLRIGMNEDQIFDLAEAIIDQSSEDSLGIEDVLLFLKDLITGKAGKIYDRLDMPTFFELFENYRQQRHEKLVSIRHEQKSQHNALPFNDRLSDMFPDTERNNMRDAMQQYLRSK